VAIPKSENLPAQIPIRNGAGGANIRIWRFPFISNPTPIRNDQNKKPQPLQDPPFPFRKSAPTRNSISPFLDSLIASRWDRWRRRPNRSLKKVISAIQSSFSIDLFYILFVTFFFCFAIFKIFFLQSDLGSAVRAAKLRYPLRSATKSKEVNDPPVSKRFDFDLLFDLFSSLCSCSIYLLFKLKNFRIL
jgi:hypothetical protein